MGKNNGQSCGWAVAREGEAPAEPQLWLICGHSSRQGQREFEPTKDLKVNFSRTPPISQMPQHDLDICVINPSRPVLVKPNVSHLGFGHQLVTFLREVGSNADSILLRHLRLFSRRLISASKTL